ncbi:hypothetical protein A3H80_01895 [Candidatus Roizmanbacteria bacterium RIFCSPLOWO2_02_FULL_37_19]|uniref:Uncharacterized protein n=1 Tax=Candidatus Roizmanbacteria bacterium RIFCSPHIGHO2_02_FULL_37_24 TaxID=1802037 RepID=A0A1F7GWQ7_9BACT|nr:MAG: hypothetical protein A2862_02545 [Candidatus Roizmanbacteria bacterium RIFCSPHIGHO2_01_FULL_38_41]OGK23527.1 MAG: hypothetical protein A3C24_01895 [Candidatus Roizmanbacteria bacterium RIFCSPHIGHO2_02_FULL_37_24]OGK31933.1 MAG: hypothetical protein A3E10_05365 [Candidatus Roizmanbacteria bacterium RIFCSPHIGHO2_12_FULL_37_23]OGK45417.1 MAG: hypothetical protein A2956_04830 [Candidatus Roizmanbacteria bacterium RIFCSPLOWO2_01_FULL_37_57]OGK54063.1 MAG: hypothetical protein A3H80_01895 [Ca
MDENIPQLLYYATITFADGSVETPSFFVFDNMPKGIEMVKKFYEKEGRPMKSITIKELIFIDSRVIPKETHIVMPNNDFGLSEDFRDRLMDQDLVERAEEENSTESIMAIFPEEQEGDELLCRAFYMGPFLKEKNIDGLMRSLLQDPFEISTPIDYLWFYRPTGESKYLSFNN